MFNDIYNDDIISINKYAPIYLKYRQNLARSQWKKPFILPSRIVVLSDGNSLDDMLFPVLADKPKVEKIFVDAFEGLGLSELAKKSKEESALTISVDTFKTKNFENTAFILMVDAKKYNNRWFELLELCAKKANAHKNNKILVNLFLPAIRDIPGGIEKLEEREYSFFLEKIVKDHTNAEKFVIKFEAACRKIVSELNKAKITLLRYDNILSPSGCDFAAFDLVELVKNAFTDGEVVVTKQDHVNKISCIYQKDALMSLLAGLCFSKNGHVYNVTRYSVTIADFKEKLHKQFPEKIAFKTDGLTYSKEETVNHNLSSLKFLHEQPKLSKQMKTFDDATYCIFCSIMDIPFNVISRLTCYEGKLNRLKSAEIDILKEIDRICRKHDIQYFLAGGSCLGAIRDNRSIPWDDDLDIGMLREDFEKFRKIAPQELGEKFIYSSPDTDSNCHYYFDKIRLKDTYFSTFYSNKFVFADGVFVDIVVYDQTTKNPIKRKRQIRFISYMVKAIHLRWHGYPVTKGKYKKIARTVLPIMNKIPFKWYHLMYNKLATKYMKLKNPTLVLDGGAHLTAGPFARDCIANVEYTEFDGMKEAPIPTGYHEYLTFLYGPKYRPAPRLSSRLGAHKIARLDLGKYVFENDPKEKFRSVDIRGELFETEEQN